MSTVKTLTPLPDFRSLDHEEFAFHYLGLTIVLGQGRTVLLRRRILTWRIGSHLITVSYVLVCYRTSFPEQGGLLLERHPKKVADGESYRYAAESRTRSLDDTLEAGWQR